MSFTYRNSAQTWKPEEVGETLEGELLERERVLAPADDDGNRRPQMRLEIQTDDGDVWTVWVGQVVLKKRFAHANPQVGDRIGMEYQGKSGQTKLFDVQSDPIREPDTALAAWFKLAHVDPDDLDDRPTMTEADAGDLIGEATSKSA